jgi:hypothetical protein
LYVIDNSQRERRRRGSKAKGISVERFGFEDKSLSRFHHHPSFTSLLANEVYAYLAFTGD